MRNELKPEELNRLRTYPPRKKGALYFGCFLTPKIRGELDELAAASGLTASAFVRQIIHKQHVIDFGPERPREVPR